MRDTPYKIYSASAGSGKTFTLVKAYLKIVLSWEFNSEFRQLLAITFTNKAVNEMKQRILGSLFEFSQTKTEENASPLFKSLMTELQLTTEELQIKSKRTLKQILHNYAFFDVSTIDKFTHRLIRTFAKDLKLPQNFEVVLDTDLLLDEAVGRLVSRAGMDKKLTSVLIEFALEKIDDAKSWDISTDLHKIGQLLFNENHLQHINALKNNSIEDFLEMKYQMVSKMRALELKAKNKAEETLEFIEQCGLEYSDFPRETLPNHFKKIRDATLEVSALYNNRLEENLKEGKILKAGMLLPSNEIAETILLNYLSLKETIYQIAFLKNGYINSVPLTILNAVQQEMKALEKERDLLPISYFNAIVSNEIKNQPAPFIYERLGEKYRHYFIDEFQDTSEMQWNNLIPLISSALESEDEQGHRGSLLLVGDAKQAIYRWRGGRAEQFLNLLSLSHKPFAVMPEINDLPVNYRSNKAIVTFNNDFFGATSSLINNDAYQSLFIDGNKQESDSAEGGLVQLCFLDKEDSKTLDELYCEKVLETIKTVTEFSYEFGDISILTRKRKHGILLSNFLMQHKIPLISSETLLLKNNNRVTFLINLLRHSTHPQDLETCYDILYFLHAEKNGKHKYIQENIESVPATLLREYGFDFDHLKQHSVYDGLEIAIKQFKLAQTSDAYLSFLLDEVLRVEQQEDSGISTFLNYWEKKKDKISIVAPETMNAVRIMTVHKAKGLEFPVVIFPYANTHIYEEINPKLWLPIKEWGIGRFKEILISKKQEVVHYSREAERLYKAEQHKLELDAFNLLYVALTRAINALYVITEEDLTASRSHKPHYYSGLFIHYLKERNLWMEGKDLYSFGSLTPRKTSTPISAMEEYIPFQYSHKDRSAFKILTASGMLWDTGREEALSKGTLLHRLMEEIVFASDMEHSLDLLQKSGALNEEVDAYRKVITGIVSHPELQSLYKNDLIVKNECEIITENGVILRPDRLVFKGNKVSVIDYKTGMKSPKHHEQLYAYTDALKAMGYEIGHKIIVYINQNIHPEFI